MNDTIYRQEAIDAAIEAAYKWDGCYSVERARIIADDLKALPSAQLKRQMGRWIEYIPNHGKCPFCGNQVDLLNGKTNSFCSECGADMRGREQE